MVVIEPHSSLRYLLQVFGALTERREVSDMGGPRAISFREMEAYTNLMRIDLTPQDYDFICAMDRAFITAYHEVVTKKT